MLRVIAIGVLASAVSNQTTSNVTVVVQTNDIWALVVAIYGAILATILATYQYASSRPRIEIKISTGFALGANDDAHRLLIWDVINHGPVPMTIRSMFFQLPDDTTRVFPAPYGLWAPETTPRVDSQNAYQYNWPEQNLRTALQSSQIKGKVKLTGCVIVATGKMYKSKSFHFKV